MEDTSAYYRGYRSGYFWGRIAEIRGEPYDDGTALEQRRAKDIGYDGEDEEKDA